MEISWALVAGAWRRASVYLPPGADCPTGYVHPSTVVVLLEDPIEVPFGEVTAWFATWPVPVEQYGVEALTREAIDWRKRRAQPVEVRPFSAIGRLVVDDGC